MFWIMMKRFVKRNSKFLTQVSSRPAIMFALIFLLLINSSNLASSVESCSGTPAVNGSTTNEYLISDCNILLSFKDIGHSDWSVKKPIHEWKGVTVENDRVKALDLSRRGLLYGPIPKELSQLSNLKTLDLSHNSLSELIPKELSQLSNLKTLNLRDNDLSGPIPKELSQLSNLKTLDLSGNYLSGPIPKELSQLSNLKTLDLRRNRLSGLIPKELSQLSSLETLDLSGNSLSGLIPKELSQLSNLKTLNLRGNYLSGPIPKELDDHLGSMFLLPTNSSNLMGSVESCSGTPAVNGSTTNEYLISDCNILLSFKDIAHSDWSVKKPIHEWKGVTVKNDRIIALSLRGRWLNSGYSGARQLPSFKIPKELSQLSNLETLDLGGGYHLHGVSHYRFSGPIPKELSQLSNLKTLNLSHNYLSGPIPKELSQLSNLKTLDLSRNDLSGPIPKELDDHLDSGILDLYGNRQISAERSRRATFIGISLVTIIGILIMLSSSILFNPKSLLKGILSASIPVGILCLCFGILASLLFEGIKLVNTPFTTYFLLFNIHTLLFLVVIPLNALAFSSLGVFFSRTRLGKIQGKLIKNPNTEALRIAILLGILFSLSAIAYSWVAVIIGVLSSS